MIRIKLIHYHPRERKRQRVNRIHFLIETPEGVFFPKYMVKVIPLTIKLSTSKSSISCVPFVWSKYVTKTDDHIRPSTHSRYVPVENHMPEKRNYRWVVIGLRFLAAMVSIQRCRKVKRFSFFLNTILAVVPRRTGWQRSPTTLANGLSFPPPPSCT